MNRAADTRGMRDPSSPDQIRNVVIVGPTGAGKTALFERLVAACVPSRRPRDSHETSLALTVAAVEHNELSLNLLDTPGHPDFVGEVRAGLRAADAALFVVSAVDGIDEATRLLWRECEVLGLPRAVAVSQLEQSRGGLRGHRGTVPADVRRRPAARPSPDERGQRHRAQPTCSAARCGTTPATSRGEREPDARGGRSHRGAPRHPHRVGHRGVRGRDAARPLPRGRGRSTSRRSPPTCGRRSPRPASSRCCRSHAPTGVGVEELLELIEQGFSRRRRARIRRPSYTPVGGDFGAVACDPDGPLVAEVVRTTTDPYVGRLSLVRVFSGTLRPDEPVHVSGHLSEFVGRERRRATATTTATTSGSGRCRRPSVDETRRPSRRASPATSSSCPSCSQAETSDTLSGKDRPALVEPWCCPEPAAARRDPRQVQGRRGQARHARCSGSSPRT